MVAITYWSILPCITITQTLHDTVHNVCAHHVCLQWNVCDIHDMCTLYTCAHTTQAFGDSCRHTLRLRATVLMNY